MNAYMNKLLSVDLSSGRVSDEPLNQRYAEQFIGGSGLAARYLYDRVDGTTDPLGPDNPLLFMAGPLVGTAGPACGRYVVCALSPATGLWGEANSGGEFGAQMRFAGYDGIILRGQSPRPVFLSVVEGTARLHDASALWGKDSYATQSIVKEQLGESKASVACIGPAGEHLVKFAAVMNDEGRAAGRSGMGAVMGSKNLKAIAVRGRQPIELADSQRFKDAIHQAFLALKEDFTASMLRDTGTAGAVEFLMSIGDMPARYFTQGYLANADKLSGGTMAESILVKNGACYRCPIACWRVTAIKEGPYRQAQIDGPEYETVAALGSLLQSDNLEAVAYAGHLCNAYGMDTISVGSTIAFAYYLFNQEIITEKETGGLTLRWGDIDTAIRLIPMIAQRQGFGAILAEGTKRLGQRFNAEELAVQVNGLEVPMHDPRALSGLALIYATSPRGACHNQGDMYLVDMGHGVDALGIAPGEKTSSAGKAVNAVRIQDWRSTYNSLIMCIFSNPEPQTIADMLNAATGWEMSLRDLMAVGERVWNLKRALNNRRGLTRANDKLPKLLRQPLPDGPVAGVVPDLDRMLHEYYAVRGWDWGTGKPTPEKLKELGLEEIVRDLYPRGVRQQTSEYR